MRRPGRRALASLALAAAGAAVVALTLARSEEPPPAPVPEEAVRVSTELSPIRAPFGELVTATVEVVADARRVAEDSIQVDAFFRPYRPVGPRTVRRQRAGDVLVATYEYPIQCVDRACAPDGPAKVVTLPTGEVRYELRDGSDDSVLLGWPQAAATSWLDEQELVELEAREDALPPEPGLRGSATLLGWAAAGLAVLLLAAAGFAARRLARPSPPAELPVAEDALASAILLATAALGHDEEGRRVALDHLARELDRRGRVALAEEARRLAWSTAAPERAELEQLVVAARDRGAPA